MVSLRTLRRLGAAAIVLVGPVAGAGPARAQAPPVTACPEGGLGLPTACVSGDGAKPSISVAPAEVVEEERRPVWVGVVFGVGGLAGIVYGVRPVRRPEPATR